MTTLEKYELIDYFLFIYSKRKLDEILIIQPISIYISYLSHNSL